MPKQGRGGRQNKNFGAKRELILKNPSESDYAQVVKNLGNKRLEVMLFSTGRNLSCKIRGSLRVWITTGDIVLVSIRDFQDDRGDVIWKYTADEARKLKKTGEIPQSTKINELDNTASRSSEFVEFIDKNMEEEEEDRIPSQRNYDLPTDESESD